ERRAQYSVPAHSLTSARKGFGRLSCPCGRHRSTGRHSATQRARCCGSFSARNFDWRYSQLPARERSSKRMREHEADDRAVVVEAHSSFAIIRFNRPAERNPLSIATLKELEIAVCDLTTRAYIKAIIFTGAGDVFASGANIRELRTLIPATAKEFSM